MISDHMPSVFEMPLPCHIVKPCTPAEHSHFVNSSVIPQFSTAFNSVSSPTESLDFNPDVEAISSCFHLTCQTVLDTVALLKQGFLNLDPSHACFCCCFLLVR